MVAIADSAVGARLIKKQPKSFYGAPGQNLNVEDLLSYLKSENILMPTPSEVHEYLTHHTGIVNSLMPTVEMVVAYFGEHSQISLEVYRDPEIDDSYLAIYIRQNPYREDILELIDEVNDRIAHHLGDETGGWIFITTDFNFPT